MARITTAIRERVESILNSGVETVTAESVNTEDAAIENIQLLTANGGETTEYAGDAVTLAGSETQVIFDLTDPVDVVSGAIYGPLPRNMGVTFGDGSSQMYHNAGNSRGYGYADGDESSTYVGMIDIPILKDVSKIWFSSGLGSDGRYGWRVLTV